MSWDSNQYLKFEKERTQACIDLQKRLTDNYNAILDLGCGPGNSTRILQNAYSNADIIGFDADENMLEKAKKTNPSIKFVKGFAPNDLGKLDKKFDLVFSNACIHWIKEQEKLIDEVYAKLNSGGTFAVQIPLTNESQFYKLLYSLIDEKWTSLQSINNFHNFNQTDYYNTLISRFNSVSIWKTDYYHIVDNKNMIVEWYKGSGLKPYLESLTETDKSHFINDLTEKMIGIMNCLMTANCS